jgi:deoxyribose-phosphate aldolase
MHYVTRLCHQMQKHKFNVMCASTCFVESVTVSLEHEKECTDIDCPERTGMHYVTRR